MIKFSFMLHRVHFFDQHKFRKFLQFFTKHFLTQKPKITTTIFVLAQHQRTIIKVKKVSIL